MKWKLYFLSISILALVIRLILLDFESTDYKEFLIKWCTYIEENGGFKALKSIESDYNNIYLYFLVICTYLPGTYIVKIKAFSIIFDFLTAIITYILVRAIEGKEKRNIAAIAYSIILFLPTVIINGAMWGQCDVIYTFFIIVSIYAVFRKEYKLSFIFFGLALSFKLQAIFILPMYLILYMKKKEFSIFNFMLIPLVMFIINMPMLLLGQDIAMFFKSYTVQMSEYKDVVLNYPNIYNLIGIDNDTVATLGIILAISVLGIITFGVISNNKKISDKEIVGLSALIILVSVYFLPHMHERYSFCGEILLTIYYILNKRRIYIAILSIGIISNSYLSFLCNCSFIDKVSGSLTQLLVIIVLFMDLIEESSCSKKLI